ncbi:MAG: GxxExxY protein [Anaerolineales bacterium]|nr:GxxExxY protein [Anaerolineales bacterium]
MPLEFEALTGLIIGAAIEVHKILGPGFLEKIYENALFIQLEKLGLKVERQVEVIVKFDGKEVGRHRIDLLVSGNIVVELKAVSDFEPVHFAIVRSYLRAMGLKHGLIINFAKTKVDARRVQA